MYRAALKAFKTPSLLHQQRSLLSTELLSRFQDTVSIQSASFLLCVLSSSQGPRHLLCYLCNDPLSCSQGLQDTFLCSTSNALLLSTELISRLSRSLLSSACIALYVGTELLSRLPRHHPCSISNALLVSTELLSRFQDTVSIQSASVLSCVLSSSQGFQDTFSVTSAMIL